MTLEPVLLALEGVGGESLVVGGSGLVAPDEE